MSEIKCNCRESKNIEDPTLEELEKMVEDWILGNDFNKDNTHKCASPSGVCTCDKTVISTKVDVQFAGDVIKDFKKNETKIQQFNKWVDELVFPAKRDTIIRNLNFYNTESAEIVELCFYTNEHSYIITAKDIYGEDGYLSCGASIRKNRAGEDWSRGNDLTDGPFTRETWDRIILSIVKYELVQLSKQIFNKIN